MISRETIKNTTGILGKKMIIYEIKNSSDGFDSRMGMAEKSVSFKTLKIIHFEGQREK